MVVEAARRMLSEDVGSLPVVEGDALVGMVTDRDLCCMSSPRISTAQGSGLGRLLREPVTAQPESR
jgi:predicted transcriptional regulator